MNAVAPTAQATPTNVTLNLARWAAEEPARVAVRSSDGRELTFEELERRCNRIAHGLRRLGLGRGDRVCLFVRPSPELIAITHALFRNGSVPVLIDPGMGRKALLSCVESMRPEGLIGVPRAHVARILFPAAFRTVEHHVTVGRRLGWGGATLDELEEGSDDALCCADTAGDDEAAILFTSGSTGPPKGVAYTHGIFGAQLAALRELYDLTPGEVDVACFPLFALFDNALGMTSVFPELDPSRPATCDPATIYRTLEESGASFTFGSPAIWRRVLPWARAHGKRLTHLRRITIAGAPVPPDLLAGLMELLPDGGEVHTPYGATEALPVSSISASEVAKLRARVEGGEGTCVGRPAPGIELRLAPVVDEALDAGALDDEVSTGEICVRGAVVTHEYKHAPEATRLAKIADHGTIWHRMGDVGRFDEEGRLWYLGRKSHRLQTERGMLMPVPIENVFNTTESVHRTALVGVGPPGRERAHLIVEAEAGARRAVLLESLRRTARSIPGLEPIEDFLFHRGFPVDVRHNAKIHRGELKLWAEKKRS